MEKKKEETSLRQRTEMQIINTRPPQGKGGSLTIRYETHQLQGKVSRRGSQLRQPGGWLKELICMLLSSPTDSQEAPVDKVTSVSLPVCQPHAENGSNAPQTFRRVREKPLFLIIRTTMTLHSCQR